MVLVGDETPWGTATAFCKSNPLDGLHACVTHAIESFPDRLAMASHVLDTDGPHVMAFRCRVDGETHGKADQ